MQINKKRSWELTGEQQYTGGGVIYWMSRDQRVKDNYALLEAVDNANRLHTSVAVVFTLVPGFLNACLRQYDFMLKGLMETEKKLKNLNIPFYLLAGNPSDEITAFVKKNNIGVIITDFDPLRIKRKWKEEVIANCGCPVIETDAHNIIPIGEVSDKTEYAAYTIRPKIHKKLAEYLVDIPAVTKQKPENMQNVSTVDWKKVYSLLKVDKSVAPVNWITPGVEAAHTMLELFLKEKLNRYADDRNDPNKDALSNLSPYLHFGHISAQRIAYRISKDFADSPGADAFLEELIVRRELADNFCYFTEEYDTFNGFHRWAKQTLNEHRSDKRDYLYSLEQFEQAKTHDDLWNAAQLEMTIRGKMHGFMRMYWAKKILEWTESPEQAMEFAIYLNDKYELDGRDPNGYAGIAWSIGGVHDRAWQIHEVYGKVRYMNYNGCKRKFDVKAYIQSVNNLR